MTNRFRMQKQRFTKFSNLEKLNFENIDSLFGGIRPSKCQFSTLTEHEAVGKKHANKYGTAWTFIRNPKEKIDKNTHVPNRQRTQSKPLKKVYKRVT